MARGKSKKKVSLGTSGSQSRWVVAREESKKKANPFEKSKAVEKRKDTLLKEYASRKKSNLFADRRIGENNPGLTAEEKELQRFTYAKQKFHSKSNAYSLGEDELTHMGQSLADDNQLKDTRAFAMSSDEEDESDRRAAGKFVKDAHFGGFGGGLFDKRQPGAETERRTQKDIMEEIVAKSKKKKAERQMQRDVVQDLTDKADEQWKSLASLFADGQVKKVKEKEKPKADSFDITVRELAFEARKAQATDLSKTKEVMAEETSKRRQKEEEERVKRMHAPDTSDVLNGHCSVDSLKAPSSKKEPRFSVRYQDGQLVMPEKNDDFVWQSGFQKQSEDDDDLDSDDYDSDEDDDDDDEDDDEDGDEDSEEEEEEEADWDASGSEEMDDDENSGEDGDGDEEDDMEADGVQEDEGVSKDNSRQGAGEADPSVGVKEKAPKSLQQLSNRLRNRSSVEQTMTLEKIIACNHSKLAAGNRPKMQALFGFVLEYLDEVVSEDSSHAPLIDAFSRPLLDLARDNMQSTSECMHDRLVESRQLVAEARKDPSLPSLPIRMRVTLQVAGAIYSTSDFRHRIVSPSLLLMADYLAHCSLNADSLLSGLWICQLLLQYLRQSKRFMPEMVNFLTGIIAISAPASSSSPASPAHDLASLTPPFSNSTAEQRSAVLRAQEKCASNGLVSIAVQLLQEVTNLYSSVTSFPELFAPASAHLRRLPVSRLSADAKEARTALVKRFSATPPRRPVLQMLKKKPVPLKLYEPNLDERYAICRKTQGGGFTHNRHGLGRNQQEREMSKLKTRLKKENKSAMRELRKDSQAIAKEVLNEQLERDATRKKKVNKLLHDVRQS
ncbi:nucleolar protein 14-like [Sycon ciliatum]|uniref:nucleolar protein 14-like n=1 Tax=Sycon ciliatum TaxID=27933 RepID=UPI0031F6FF5B